MGTQCGPEGPELQRALDFFATNFESLGLKMNAKKTEYMVMTGGISNVYICQTRLMFARTREWV